MKSNLQEELKNLLKCLCSIGPASNELIQMLFILPQKSRMLMNLYSEFMESEDDLMKIFSLRYTSDGFIEASTYPCPLGYHLAGLYHSLFEILMDNDKRKHLLRLANITEEEFKEFDPLRFWIKISIEFLANYNKDALRLLDVIVDKLSGKRPDEYIDWEEIKKSISIKDFEVLRNILKRFFLIYEESSSYIYGRNCPLLLDVYSDLRAKLKELLR